MTGVNTINSDSTLAGVKESNSKTKKTDAFQSIMNIAQNVSTKIETRVASKDTAEEVATKPTAKDVIVSKLNAANHQIKTKSSLDDLDSQAEEIMGQLMISIKQEIMNLLGITEEELAAAMETLGLEDTDLLSSANITDLTVYMVTGQEESIQLLFHPEFAETLKELQSNIRDLQAEVLTKLNVTEQEFHNLVEEMSKDSTNMDIVAEREELPNAGTNPKVNEERLEAKIVYEEEKSLETAATIETEDSNQENLTEGNQNQATNLAASAGANVVTNLETVLETLTDEAEATSIVKQITDEIQISMKQGVTSMELQLNPENLGKIHLEVVAKNGVITASIATETLMAKEAIESQMLVLKENLLNQGVKVEEVEVTIATHQFEQNLDDHKEKEEETNSGKRKLNLDGLDLEVEELDAADILEQSIMMSNGNSVSLTV